MLRPLTRRQLGGILVLGLLPGCGSPAPQHPAHPARPAPLPADRIDPALSVHRLELPRPGAGPHDPGLWVVLTRQAAGRLPVVVYLPGLGQDAEAGQRWAAAWAAAGYAVVSVQPLDADAQAWRSELARSGEFQELGRRHTGEAMRRERLAALRALVTRLQGLPVPPWSDLDWTRSAVAGYETGALTALDLARSAVDAGWQPQAAIALSPWPDEPSPPLHAPLLCISSDQDGDPLGLVARPTERRRGFAKLEGAAAYWLSLHGVSHAGLAGTRPPEPFEAQDQRHADTRSGGFTRRGGSLGSGGDGAYLPGQRGGGAGGGLRSGSATEASRADLREAWRLSVAFLDAQLRASPAAQDALHQGAEAGKGVWLQSASSPRKPPL